MKRHRFIGNFDFSQSKLVIADAEIVNQIKNVLRFKVGDKLILSGGKMHEAEVLIKRIDKKGIEVEILTKSENRNDPQREVMLYCSILKKENFELVAQKAVEVGVKKIIPVICEHTVKLGFKKNRLEKIAKEAAEQSGRGGVSEIGEIMDFEHAVAEAAGIGDAILFEIGAPMFSGSDLSKNSVSIFIGPEGGWSVKELEFAQRKGIKFYSLGKLTLRAETAAIVAAYLCSWH